MTTKKPDFGDTVAQEEAEFRASLTDVVEPLVTTTVINVNQANRGPGIFTFDAPQPIPAGIRFATFDVTLTDSDLLVFGRVIKIEFWFSLDGVAPYEFANSTTWNSYGPAGLTVTDPNGTVRVNPGPRIQVPLALRAGQFLRGSVDLNLRMRSGLTISITS